MNSTRISLSLSFCACALLTLTAWSPAASAQTCNGTLYSGQDLLNMGYADLSNRTVTASSTDTSIDFEGYFLSPPSQRAVERIALIPAVCPYPDDGSTIRVTINNTRLPAINAPFQADHDFFMGLNNGTFLSMVGVADNLTGSMGAPWADFPFTTAPLSSFNPAPPLNGTGLMPGFGGAYEFSGEWTIGTTETAALNEWGSFDLAADHPPINLSQSVDFALVSGDTTEQYRVNWLCIETSPDCGPTCEQYLDSVCSPNLVYCKRGTYQSCVATNAGDCATQATTSTLPTNPPAQWAKQRIDDETVKVDKDDPNCFP